jgi:hypothetical protein
MLGNGQRAADVYKDALDRLDVVGLDLRVPTVDTLSGPWAADVASLADEISDEDARQKLGDARIPTVLPPSRCR